MKYKRSSTGGKTRARIKIYIFTIAIIISMLFSTPGIAASEMIDSGMESAMRSNFFLNIIGKTVSALKAEKNSDDKSFIGNFSVNPFNIVNKEISFLKGEKMAFVNDENNKAVDLIQNIVINPFKINDGSVSRVEATVDVIGDPLDNSKKRILIYHTHTNEAYVEGNTGLESTVAAVGDVLTDELEKMGFTVIHDKTVHDVADYNNAYHESRKTLTNYLNSYGDFDMIIDLHRDSVANKTNITGNIDGKSIAKLMFVTATWNPRYSAQLEKIESMVAIANNLYPELFRKNYNYQYLDGITYYSQDLSDNAVLIEVGANSNNLQEAKNSMEYLSKVIATYLNQ